MGAFAIALGESPAWMAAAAATPQAKAVNGPAPVTPVIVKAAPAGAGQVADLPTVRRRREEESASEPPSTIGRIAALVAVCLAIAGLIVFIVRLNSGPRIPVQLLDTGTDSGEIVSSTRWVHCVFSPLYIASPCRQATA